MHILLRGALMAAVLGAAPFGVANAQLRAPIHSQPAAPTQAPAPPPARAPAPPPTSAPVKLTVPVGLFKLPPAQSVALSVITSAKSESASKPVSFVAAREKVDVPSHMWTPAHYAVTRETTESKPTKEETSPTSFSVTVNPLCVLDSAVAREMRRPGCDGEYSRSGESATLLG